jgi:hypothetical protein
LLADPQTTAFAHQREDLVSLYIEIMASSRFVLCPRGFGTSSWRLFEALKMGRAPAIISDQWVSPEGPAWNEFSVRIGEREIESIPKRLEELEPRAEEMGRKARDQWEQWFSMEVCFHRIVEWCLEMKRHRRVPESLSRWIAYAQFCRPSHTRALAGVIMRRLSGKA